MEINPWKVDSLEAFTCLKCPECTYFSKEEINFKNHAIKSHPLSFVFFEQSDSQVVIASEENSTLDYISGKELSKQSIPTAFYTGKSLSEALHFGFCRTWGEHVVYKNCSECQKQYLYTTCFPKV